MYETATLSLQWTQRGVTLAANRQQLKEQLIETISQLCRSVLQFESELTVEGLLGITLDHRDVLLVNINEMLTAQPEDVSRSADKNFPDVSNPEASTADTEEYCAPATSDVADVAAPSKRKRCARPPKASVRATTAQARPPSFRIAKRKSRSSKSSPIPPIAHTDSDSFNSLEAAVGLQSSEDIAEYLEMLNSQDELRCAVKQESVESSVYSDVGSDTVQSQSQQDDTLKRNGYLSAKCMQLATDADNDDDDDDVDGDDEISKISKQQFVSDPARHSSTDESDQLIISDVFSVKEEPTSDDQSQQSPAPQRHLTSESVLLRQTPVCQTPDPVTLADHSSPLQVI